jgi:DNA repair exonuclease SbcCD ATPase subunit
MQSRQPGTPPLGQLLVDRGVLTSTQLYQISLEQRITGKPLREIIIERGLASSELLENTSDGSTEAPDDPTPGSEAPAESQEDRPRGLRARAARRLDEYLAAAAAELDERGEMLERRSLALEQEAERLASAESALDERARRLGRLDIHDEDASSRIDHLIRVVAGRDAQIEDLTKERDQARDELAHTQEKLASSETEGASRERLLTARLEQETARQADELARMRAQSEAALTSAREQLRELEAENAALKAAAAIAERPLQTSHLLRVPGSGCYALVERPGPPPVVGETISQGSDDERRFVVTRVSESPLPLDERTCAYLRPE